MNSIIFVLCLVLAVAKGQIKDVTTYEINGDRSEDYIKLNRQQHAQALQDFDTQLENFKKQYAARIENLDIQRDMAVASVVQMEERLNPLELLSDTSNRCVVKHRTIIPTVVNTETTMNNCINQASTVLPTLVTNAFNYRNSMQTYFYNYFETETKKCGEKYLKSAANHTSCITTVTANTNSNIVSYQKTFSNLMDTANCAANANLKTAVDCVFNAHSSTNSRIAEANVMVNNCIMGKDECKPCPTACPESQDLKVDYEKETILNPFYGRESNEGCLLLNLKD